MLSYITPVTPCWLQQPAGVVMWGVNAEQPISYEQRAKASEPAGGLPEPGTLCLQMTWTVIAAPRNSRQLAAAAHYSRIKLNAAASSQQPLAAAGPCNSSQQSQ